MIVRVNDKPCEIVFLKFYSLVKYELFIPSVKLLDCGGELLLILTEYSAPFHPFYKMMRSHYVTHPL